MCFRSINAVRDHVPYGIKQSLIRHPPLQSLHNKFTNSLSTSDYLPSMSFVGIKFSKPTFLILYISNVNGFPILSITLKNSRFSDIKFREFCRITSLPFWVSSTPREKFFIIDCHTRGEIWHIHATQFSLPQICFIFLNTCLVSGSSLLLTRYPFWFLLYFLSSVTTLVRYLTQ